MKIIMTSSIAGPIIASPLTPNTKDGPGLANSPPDITMVTATNNGTAQSRKL